MLTPFYQLEGKIDLIKEVVYNSNCLGSWSTYIEQTWQDEKGNRSIIIREQ